MAREKAFIDEKAIVRVAFDTVNAEGWNFSLRSLARKLKIAPMTIYNYVENKTDIIKRVIMLGLDILQEQLEKKLNSPVQENRTLAEIYRVLAEVTFDFASKNRQVYILMFNTELEELRGDDELAESYRGAISLFRHRLDPDTLATARKTILLFEIIMNGLILRYLRDPSMMPVGNYYDLVETAIARLFPDDINR